MQTLGLFFAVGGTAVAANFCCQNQSWGTFLEQHKKNEINSRQQLVLNKLFEGFDGKLTTPKWAKIAKCSHDTALRDIHRLINLGILVQDEGGGRSTSYSLKESFR